MPNRAIHLTPAARHAVTLEVKSRSSPASAAPAVRLPVTGGVSQAN